MVGVRRIERLMHSLKGCCHTTWLYPHKINHLECILFIFTEDSLQFALRQPSVHFLHFAPAVVVIRPACIAMREFRLPRTETGEDVLLHSDLLDYDQLLGCDLNNSNTVAIKTFDGFIQSDLDSWRIVPLELNIFHGSGFARESCGSVLLSDLNSISDFHAVTSFKMVLPVGLEPTRISAAVFETASYSDSGTGAKHC